MARTESLSIWWGMAWATAGSVIFAGTWWVLAQDNSSIFFDDTNNRLGLMTTAPTHTLTLWSTGTGIAIYNTVDQTTNYERWIIQWSSNVLLIWSQWSWSATARVARLFATSGTWWAASNFSVSRSTTPWFLMDFTTASAVTWNRCSMFTTGSSSTATSSLTNILSIAPTINQSSTAGYTILDLNPTLTAQWSWARNAIVYRNAGWSSLFAVDYLWVMSFSNVVTAWIAVASTHRIAVVDGGTTYYLLATTVA